MTSLGGVDSYKQLANKLTDAVPCEEDVPTLSGIQLAQEIAADGLTDAVGEIGFEVAVIQPTGQETPLSVTASHTISAMKAMLASSVGVSVFVQMLYKEDSEAELENSSTAGDNNIRAGTQLYMLIIDTVAFSYIDQGVVLSQDNHVAAMPTKNGTDGGYYRIAVAERPFEQGGKHTQRMKVVNYESNVLIGAISAEGGDIAKALSSHSNSGYDYGYIGNGPNGWVYDSDGDLSYNGQQVNSWQNRNQVSGLQAQTDRRSRSNQLLTAV
jgi:hypothetical protein